MPCEVVSSCQSSMVTRRPEYGPPSSGLLNLEVHPVSMEGVPTDSPLGGGSPRAPWPALVVLPDRVPADGTARSNPLSWHMNLFRVLDRATPVPPVLRLEGREFKELAVCSVRSVTSLLLVALVLGITSVVFAKRRWYPVFVAGVVLVAYMPVASCQSVVGCELQTALGTVATPVVVPLTLLWALSPVGTEASSELRSSRACWDTKTGTLTFSNCCNESDIHWCSRWLCWTKPGCTVCTHDLGCWNNLAAGVSAVPMAGTMEIRRQAMNTFGLIGWGAYLAEAFGLGEVYSVGMVASYWLVGGSAPHLNLTCGIPCSSDAVSWLEVKAPTLSEIYAWVTTIPQALYGLIAAMPIFFGLLLFYMLLRGHVVGALVLLIAVPGAVASASQCDEDSDNFDEEGDELTQCDECRWKSNDSLCICPFGKVIRKFNDTRYNISKKCPETWNVTGTWWICGWGSWWWVAYEVERPYSHPFLPPDPLTAICYITNNSQSVYNVTFKVDWDEKTTHNSSSIFGMQVTTCVLDRRDATCRGCHGACFWTDGKHDRDFGRCGGGTMDGPFTFVQLAIIRLQLNGTRFWWRPSKAVAELLLHKVRHGYGCGITHGVVNCWSCCRGLCDSEKNTNPRPPPGKWWPQPGKPADLCIDPAFERQQNNWQPNNWLSQIQYVFDAMVGKVGCPVYTEPAYPVCPGHAWYPDDGGKVILIGSRQYVGALPETLRSFVGLMAVLLIFMVSSGARIVPVLVMIAAGLHLTTAECYPSCPPSTYCNSFFCVSKTPCVAEVEGHLVWPGGWPFMVSESAGISPEVIAALTPAATLSTLAQGAGLPGLGALVVAAAAFKPQPVFVRYDFYCGNNTAVDEVVGYDPFFLLYSIPLVFSTTFLFSLGCFMGILAGLELRARVPWRLVLLMLSSSTTTLLELVMVAGVVIQFVDLLTGRVAVEAAYHRALLAAPAASAAWGLPTWPEAVLGVLCVVLYMTVVGRAGLAALVAWKLSRGLIGATILLVAFGRGPDRGVLGSELCVPLLDSPIPEASFTWWYVSGMLSFFAISFAFYSHGGKRIKLRVYARWCWLYCRIRLAVAVSPVGRHGWHARATMYAWTVCSFIWPRACSAVALGLVGLGAAVDLVDWFLETVLCIRPRCTSIATTADLAARVCNNTELSALLERWWYKGWLMYDHMGQVSSDLRDRVLSLGGTCEPVSVHPEELQRIKDDTMTLTCGSWFGGKPVVARCGQYVLIGSATSVHSLPPGYTLTAPLLVTRPKKSFFKILKASMLGKCPLPGSGQVVTIDTATGTSMGLATSGVLFTTFHATSGRSLAGPTGSRNPYWSSPSDDVVCYPLIEGMSCLDPCSCGDHSRWVIRTDGQLLHGIQNSEQHVVLDCPTPIDQLKGSSGSPILCDKGHVTGMMVGAMVNSGIASRVRFVKPWSAQPGQQNTKNNIPAYPTVPASGYKMVGYIAPTGSGKSTKLPMSLAAHGHRVLVLNPSVITTKAMYKYMKTLTGRSPNVYAGTQKNAMAINNGSKITYMTYGRFLVDPDTWLRKNDVVLCDECHATDPTTVLGIGCALVGAEQCGVKLTILATATPPGTAWTPHSSITEVALDSSGTIPFYGLTLQIEQYRTGRHVIFCHSKAECTRVATELLKGGVAAVTAWRGHLEAISEAKDLVVVATDALSTGYTGNFDTVTDCCSVVEEDIDVDLNPTFTLSVCVKPADAALRMQRRGRTGRGKPGTYRYVVKGAPPSGVTSTAAAWAAAETGYVWHGLQTVTICEYLEAYQENPYTCRIPNDPCEGARCLAILKPFFRELEVTKPAVEGLSWPLLYGAQRLVCMRAGSQAPSDDIRWRGLDGEAAVPLLFRLGNVDCEITSHDFTRRMAAELGDTSYRDTGIGPILLAGAAIAAAVAIVGATGSLVISSVWEVRTGGSPVQIGADNLGDRGKVQEGGPVPVDALREVATSLDYPFLTTVWGAIKDGASLVAGTATNTACAVKGYFAGAPIVEAIPVGSAGVAILDVLHLNLLAIASGGLAVIGAKTAPALATLAALFAGAQAFAPPQIMWLTTIAGGIITSMVANPKAGCMVAAGFLAGSKLGSFGCFELLFNALAGYEACVTACALTLELLDGSADAMSWVSALPGLINPGAAVAGIVLALILRTASGSDMTPWLNRLLAAIPRSNALPDGFFAAPPEMTKLSQAVRCFSLSARLKAWCDAAKEPDYIYCSAGWIGRMARFVAGVINYIKAFIVERFPTPKVPMLSCSKGYSGKWRGTGSVTTTCACGKVLTMTADMLDDVYSTRWSGCKNALLRRIPINTTTTISGALTPDLEDDTDFTFLIGAAHLVRLVRRGQQWWLVASTLGKLTSEAVYAASEYGPVRVRDEPISTFCGDVTGGFFTEGQSIMFNCRMKRLPICLGGRQIRQPGLPYRPRLFEGAPAETVNIQCQATKEARETAKQAVEMLDTTVKVAAKMLDAKEEKVQTMKKSCERMLAECMPPPKLFTSLSKDGKGFEDPVEGMPRVVKDFLKGPDGGPIDMDAGKIGKKGVDYVMAAIKRRDELRAQVAAEFAAQHAASREKQTLETELEAVEQSERGPVRPAQCEAAKGTVLLVDEGGDLEEAEPETLPVDITKVTPERKGEDLAFREGLKEAALVEAKTVLEELEIEKAEPPSPSDAPLPLSSESVLDGTDTPDALKAAAEEATTIIGAAYKVAAVGAGAARAAGAALASGATKATKTTAGAVSATATKAAALLKRGAKGAGRVLASARKEDPVEVFDLTTLRNVTVSWSCGSGGSDAVRTSDFDRIGDLPSLTRLPKDHKHTFKDVNTGLSLADRTRLSTLPDHGIELQAVCVDCDTKPKGDVVVRTLRHQCCGEDKSLTKTFGSRTPCVLLGPLWGDAKGGIWKDGDRILCDEDEIGSTGRVLDLVHESEEKCGLSYIWSGAPIAVQEPKRPPVTRPLTAQLRARADQVYVTQPQDIYRRLQKVTIEQVEAQVDEEFRDAYNLAKAKASRILSPQWTYEEAVAKVKARSARGHVANITVADLQTSRGRRIVEEARDGILTGTLEAPFMLRPKSEVFPNTKGSRKPPRLICYPSLEFRVAEKMILGDPSLVAKAVMGPAYGFQYPPHQRAKVLSDMWKSKRSPICYTLDGVCFDSTITEADIEREGEIFAAASSDPAAVRALHKYYAKGPMVGADGLVVGVRHCRASGTLTTSSGNSITCYLKVSAACRKAKIPNPSFLIHGDDVVVIAEKDEEDHCDALAAALKSYGYACTPEVHADLSTAESCSATLDSVRTVRGIRPVLSTDMRRGLGRVLAEYGDPVGTAWGYTVSYPTHPIVCYVLLPVLLQTALNNGDGPDQDVTVDVRGNTLKLPLSSLGSALRSLHGPDILCVTGRSATVMQQTAQCLQFFGMRGIGYWRRIRAKVKVRLRKAGPAWAALAHELLWNPGDSDGPLVEPGTVQIPTELWEHSWEGLELTLSPRKLFTRSFKIMALIALVAIGVSFFIPVSVLGLG